jgi:hypothetical protein
MLEGPILQRIEPSSMDNLLSCDAFPKMRDSRIDVTSARTIGA